MWDIVDGLSLRNPINISDWSSSLAQQTYQLNCPSAENEIIAVTVNIYGELICRICTVETPYLSTNYLSRHVTENILSYYNYLAHEMIRKSMTIMSTTMNRYQRSNIMIYCGKYHGTFLHYIRFLLILRKNYICT